MNLQTEMSMEVQFAVQQRTVTVVVTVTPPSYLHPKLIAHILIISMRHNRGSVSYLCWEDQGFRVED